MKGVRRLALWAFWDSVIILLWLSMFALVLLAGVAYALNLDPKSEAWAVLIKALASAFLLLSAVRLTHGLTPRTARFWPRYLVLTQSVCLVVFARDLGGFSSVGHHFVCGALTSMLCAGHYVWRARLETAPRKTVVVADDFIDELLADAGQ